MFRLRRDVFGEKASSAHARGAWETYTHMRNLRIQTRQSKQNDKASKASAHEREKRAMQFLRIKILRRDRPEEAHDKT